MTRKSILPPSQNLCEENHTGKGDYIKIGADYLHFFTSIGGLKPSHKVLDIGCGLGRMAIPVLNYIKVPWYRRAFAFPGINYFGMDINKASIDWCRNNISSHYPSARFEWMDVHNPLYNPKGIHAPSDYRFPFKSETFDFIFLTSVFTHMRPEGVRNYLLEIKRMLKPKGRCFITYFLINDESRQLMAENENLKIFLYGLKLNVPSFRCRFEGFYAEEETVPEKIIALDESMVISLYTEIGLQMRGSIQYGCWCGRENHLSYQDIIVAEKSCGVH